MKQAAQPQNSPPIRSNKGSSYDSLRHPEPIPTAAAPSEGIKAPESGFLDAVEDSVRQHGEEPIYGDSEGMKCRQSLILMDSRYEHMFTL